MTTEPTDAMTGGLGYAEAAAELGAILDRLDSDAIDVDDLAHQVRRAAELIRHCRARIAEARIEVERVADELADLAEETDGTEHPA